MLAKSHFENNEKKTFNLKPEDLFASWTNELLPPYISYKHDPNVLAIDAWNWKKYLFY